MMACFNHSRYSFIFFALFILIATFFIMNLFTAAAYLQYQQCEARYEEVALALTEEHLRQAFELLDTDGSGTLERSEMLQVVSDLRQAHLLPGIVQV